MKVVPIRWLGAGRADELRALVAGRMTRWLASWSRTAERSECQVELLADGSALVGGGEWLAQSGTHGTLWLRSSEETLERFGCRLLSMEVSDGHGIASRVGRRALAELAAQLTASNSELRSVPRPSDELAPRRGVASFACRIDRLRFELHVDDALGAFLLPKAGKQVALIPRLEAIGQSKVELNAVLELGAMKLEDTIVLRPGEVIKTQVPLDRPIAVRNGDGQTVFIGTLVAADGHRALRCTRIHSNEQKPS